MKLLTDQECQEGIKQICDLSKTIARELGIHLQVVQFDSGRHLTCKKTHSLRISARGKSVTVSIFHSDVVGSLSCNDPPRAKIRAAIERLKLLLDG